MGMGEYMTDLYAHAEAQGYKIDSLTVQERHSYNSAYSYITVNYVIPVGKNRKDAIDADIKGKFGDI